MQVKLSAMPQKKNLWKYLRYIFGNKYLIVTVLAIIFITFFDTNSLNKRYTTRQQVREVQKEIRYYEEKIEKEKATIQGLKTSKEAVEKFARETYNMKKDNEIIFIINE